MLRSNNNDNFVDGGLGLGPHLVGKQIDINGRSLSICKQLGEGGFSFVYLVRDKEGIGGSTSNDWEREGTKTSSHSRGNSRDGEDQAIRNDLSQNKIDPQHSSLRNNPHLHHQQSSQQQSNQNYPQHLHSSQSQPSPPYGTPMVLKITSVHTSSQRSMAEREAKLLQQLSHPSIVQVYDHGFRDPYYSNNTSVGGGGVGNGPTGGISSSTDSTNGIGDGNHRLAHSSSNSSGIVNEMSNSVKNNSGNNHISGHLSSSSSKSIQHLILMEYCEGGTAFDAIKRMRQSSLSSSDPHVASNSGTPLQRFDLHSLVISFGQICNAVSYLHAQRPPIIHRDLKPVNFLIKNGAYKLCDFGSAVRGHTDLKTPEDRRRAEEVVHKTTTQMFRAPEMVDLYMAKKLTQSTDVWALGCCLYSLAFLRDCFEEGSNLAILSRKFKIPNDNPYGEGIVDLIDRMLTSDYKERADMSEVIMCLSALYSNRPLPKRKKRAGKAKEKEDEGVRVGAYRTDGQGIRQSMAKKQEKKIMEAKKLNPNSAAAKRKKASEGHKQKEPIQPYQLDGTDTPLKNSSQNDKVLKQGNDATLPKVDSDFGNFASFDKAFESNFDPFHSGNITDNTFSTSQNDGINHADERGTQTNAKTQSDEGFPSSSFEQQCLIANDSNFHSFAAVTSNDTAGVGDAFEMTFEDFNVRQTSFPSSQKNPNFNSSRNFFDARAENSLNTSNFVQSSMGSFRDAGIDNSSTDVMNGKKKRGIFGILSKR